ncbi:thiol reductant ABC exporter subunit CydC [Priestia aryabhattai]|uniref:thiol reductant ABC exporter subunit CydC n=2 Tax=Priestia TaxID=2800373 RepID=UPI001C8D0976|nr:thiol reductant ABC exporter subunit CydC [Priestia aryabhattai]MBX9984138.1 thiol reductant ABC exporter subunit CydC [Priestia aryabhattai]MBY0003126.1 thiol reductant ABC exporter subunit CydC [Priestia aryabhattai]
MMKYKSWIWPYFKTYKYRIFSILLLSLLTIGSAGALMFTSGYLISASSLRPETILLVYVPIVLVRTFGLSRAAFRYAERLVSHDFILRILAKMRTRLYHLIEPLIATSRYQTGDVLGVLAEDIESLQDLFLRTILPTISAVILYVISIVSLGFFSLKFACLIAIYLFLLVVVMPLFSLWHMKAANKRYKSSKAQLYAKVTDGFLGVADWVLSGQQQSFFHSYNKTENELDGMDRKLKLWTYYRELFGQLIVAGLIVTMIWFGASLFADKELAGVFIAAFILVVFPLSEALLPVANAVEKIPQFEESLNRVQAMEKNWEDVNEKKKHTLSLPYKGSWNSVRLEVEHVSFRYSNEEESVIHDLSFQVEQGEKIAILGKSGAGKSTLLKLLQGSLVPTEGTVQLNGQSVAEVREDVPKLISVLNQNPYLFNTSVANNLLLANEEATKEEVIEAMKQVNMHSLVEGLHQGYQTPMLETGQRFSGGERQRIALARVLLQHTPIVMLDEPTAGLDAMTEKHLLSTIFETLQDKTLIWVTHNLVGMEKMDEILFLQDGKIAIRGTHDELLETNSHYQKLYELDHPAKSL